MAAAISQDNSSGIVALDRVSKTYVRDGQSVAALSNVSMVMPAGSVVGVVGRSGAGKSTLLRLVAGLLTSDEGTITVAGMTPDAARSQKLFAFMPQAPALLPWKTALENANVLASLSGRSEDAGRSALAAVGLSDVADRLPRQLSGGMQQRVALARSIATEAPLLLLDEPFSALDEITREHMRTHISNLRHHRGQSILLVTHDIGEAIDMCDTVLALGHSPGEVVTQIDTSLFSAVAEDVSGVLGHATALQRLRTALQGDGA